MRHLLLAACMLMAIGNQALAKDEVIKYGNNMTYKGQVENNLMKGTGTLTYSMGGCTFTVKGDFDDTKVQNATFQWKGLQEDLKGSGELQLTIGADGEKLDIRVLNGSIAKTKKDIYTNTLSFLNVDIPIEDKLIAVQPYKSVANTFLYIVPTEHFEVSFPTEYHGQKGTVTGQTTIPSLNFNESSDYYISFLPDGATLAYIYRRGGDPVGLLYTEDGGNYIMTGEEEISYHWKNKQGDFIFTAQMPKNHGYDQGDYVRIDRADASVFEGSVEVGAPTPATTISGTEEEALSTFTAFKEALENGNVKLLHGYDYLNNGLVDTYDNGVYKPAYRDPVAEKEWLMTAYADDDQKWSGLPTENATEVSMTHKDHPEYTVTRFDDADQQTQGMVYVAMENGQPAWVRRDIYFNRLKVKRALYLYEYQQNKYGIQSASASEKQKLETQLKADPVIKLSKQTVQKLGKLQQDLEALRAKYFAQEISLIDFNSELNKINTEIDDIYYSSSIGGLGKQGKEFISKLEAEYRNTFLFSRYNIKQIDAKTIGMFISDKDFAVARVFDKFENGKAYSHYEVIETPEAE